MNPSTATAASPWRVVAPRNSTPTTAGGNLSPRTSAAPTRSASPGAPAPAGGGAGGAAAEGPPRHGQPLAYTQAHPHKPGSEDRRDGKIGRDDRLHGEQRQLAQRY